MGHDQPARSNPPEQFVQIPLDIEHARINQTINANQRRNNWLTIIICIILALTGQSIVGLLENCYYLNKDPSVHYGVWTRSLVQFIGFPILLFPLLIFLLLSCKKQNQVPFTSEQTSRRASLAIMYPCIGIMMAGQAICSTNKQDLPYKLFTLISTTQLFFTPVISTYLNKIKLNRWMILSLFFAILTGAFTINTFSAGSPKKYKDQGVFSAVYGASLFSLILCEIMITFDIIISKRNKSTNEKLSFSAVLQLLIYTSLVATVILLACVFISGEYHDLKRAMDGFSKGEMAYVRTMVGLVLAWQVYWVGIVGLVFSVSAVFSNVISVCTWPILSLLVAFFYKSYGKFNVLSGIALATAALSVASYFYLIHKEKRDQVDEAMT